jgi:hypothetical protein
MVRDGWRAALEKSLEAFESTAVEPIGLVLPKERRRISDRILPFGRFIKSRHWSKLF